MRRRLVRSVLHLPLLELEAIGATRLLVAFTGDRRQRRHGGPQSRRRCPQMRPFYSACFAYIGWLSTREMVVAGLLCLVMHRLGRSFCARSKNGIAMASREAWDKVVSVFRMVLDGIKQLKVNRSLARRVLLSFEESVREHQRSAAARQAATPSWSRVGRSRCFTSFWARLVFGPERAGSFAETGVRSPDRASDSTPVKGPDCR